MAASMLSLSYSPNKLNIGPSQHSRGWRVNCAVIVQQEPAGFELCSPGPHRGTVRMTGSTRAHQGSTDPQIVDKKTFGGVRVDEGAFGAKLDTRRFLPERWGHSPALAFDLCPEFVCIRGGGAGARVPPKWARGVEGDLLSHRVQMPEFGGWVAGRVQGRMIQVSQKSKVLRTERCRKTYP